MDSRPFIFKQFVMQHHRSTMKIGTDSVLLARWVDVERVGSALDIGTGCGIVSLMLAQRGVQTVDAIEIDEQSSNEAAQNFRSSPWSDRLNVVHGDVRVLSDSTTKKYDLVISNPPFFTDFFKGESERRNLARHTDSLSFDELCVAAKKYMHAESRFVLVLPVLQSVEFKRIAFEEGFSLRRQQFIVPVEGKEPNRVNMDFVLYDTECVDETFVIRKADGCFTEEYNEFLKDFYITL